MTEFKKRFSEMLRRYPEALLDRRMFVALARDFFPEKRMQVNLLVNAFDIGMVEELKKIDKVDGFFLNRLANRLTNEYGISQKNAEWAIYVWCVCYSEGILGKICGTDIVVKKSSERRKPPIPKNLNAGTRGIVKIRGVQYAFRWIPAGSFLMGSPKTELGRSDEEIQHKVNISRGIWMQETEITQEMWESVMGENPSTFKGSKRRPVENISWNDCQNYLGKLNALGVCPDGFIFALPTEAEWEYSCRAGSASAFHFGSSLNGDNANCNGRHPYGTDKKGSYLGRTSEVGKYSPNAWGLFDMHGNVEEWVQDVYAPYLTGEKTDPVWTKAGNGRVTRGGGWYYRAVYCRAANRNWNDPNGRSELIGARLALRPCDEGLSSEKGEQNHFSSIPSSDKATTIIPRKDSNSNHNHSNSHSQLGSLRAGARGVAIIRGVRYAFRWIPAGSFMMGSPSTEKDPFDDPYVFTLATKQGRLDDEVQHKVSISRGFWMLESPITQEMWESIMLKNPSSFKGSKRLPVENISWNDCQEYIGKLNGLGICPKGVGFSLPTEAEWEYACRAGTMTAYHFGNSLNGNEANCNGDYPFGTNKTGRCLGKTTEVGTYPANAWGLVDMHGNVWEWVKDVYAPYLPRELTDPVNLYGGSRRVYRGGSWSSHAVSCRSARRDWFEQNYNNSNIGARLVLTPKNIVLPEVVLPSSEAELAFDEIVNAAVTEPFPAIPKFINWKKWFDEFDD